MKKKSVIESRDRKKFPFSELPATIQAEIATKLAPKEFGRLLQSSKGVNRNVKKYASLSCDHYFYNQQQNILKNFLGSFVDNKPSISFNFFPGPFSMAPRHAKAIKLLEDIHFLNLSQEKKKVLFPTREIQILIEKIKENNATVKAYESARRSKADSPSYKAFPECLKYFLYALLFVVYTICAFGGVPIDVARAAAGLTLLAFMSAVFVYVKINGYIHDCQEARRDAMIAQLKAKEARQSMEISRLVEDLDKIFNAFPKESRSLDIVVERQVVT